MNKTDEDKNAFLAAHPSAFYVHFDDFLALELVPKNVRYIGGFGAMSWIEVRGSVKECYRLCIVVCVVYVCVRERKYVQKCLFYSAKHVF